MSGKKLEEFVAIGQAAQAAIDSLLAAERAPAAIDARIERLVSEVERDASSFWVRSTGERIAVALVLDRVDWLLEDGWSSVLLAIDRLGDDWLAAAIRVRRKR